jgi:hypothetical protein
MSEATFTVEEFNKQVVEFRQMFGDKRFWAKPAASRKIAIDALSFAYFFLEKDTPQSEVERCADILHQTLGEYQMREIKLIEMGIVTDAA